MSDTRTALQRPVPSSGRTIRRALVLATYLGYILLVAMFWARSVRDLPAWFLLLVLAPGSVTLLSFVGLYTATHSIADQPDKRLDERQRLIRDRAYRSAYQVLAAVFLMSALYSYIALDSGSLWFPRTANQLNAFFWGAMLLAMTLPTAIIAWTEPDDVDEA